MKTKGLPSNRILPYPEPTVVEPSMEELEEYVFDSICESTDGCMTEPDGMCEHGHPSWLLHMGLI